MMGLSHVRFAQAHPIYPLMIPSVTVTNAYPNCTVVSSADFGARHISRRKGQAIRGGTWRRLTHSSAGVEREKKKAVQAVSSCVPPASESSVVFSLSY